MLHNSSFGYDSVRNIPTAPDYVWEEYLKVRPDAAQFRTSTILFREELSQIFDEDIGTCQLGTAIGRGIPPRPNTSLPISCEKENTFSPSDALLSGMENPIQPVAETDQVTPGMNTEDSPPVNASHEGRKRKRSSSQDSIDEMINTLRSISEKRTNSTDVIAGLGSIFNEMNEMFPTMEPREKIRLKLLFCKNSSLIPLYLSSSDAEKSQLVEQLLAAHDA